MTKEINKKEMIHVGGTIFNADLEAEAILEVLNENNEPLKFCYNISTKTLCILDYKKVFSSITVKYITQ